MTSPTKFCHIAEIILWMWSCDQSLVTLAFGTGTRYKLEILHQSVRGIEAKSQKVLGANTYVCRSYRGKTGRVVFLASLPPILNRVNISIHSSSLNIFSSSFSHLLQIIEKTNVFSNMYDILEILNFLYLPFSVLFCIIFSS